MQKQQSRFIALFSSIGAPILGSSGGACGIACVAGGCCGGPAIFGLIGLSGSTLTFVEKLTPVFFAMTVLSLGYGFYKAYRPKSQDCCAPPADAIESPCCTREKKTPFLQSKSFLWATTILCAIMWMYPYTAKTFLTSSKSTTKEHPSRGNAVYGDSADTVSHDDAGADTKAGACCPETNECETPCSE